MPIRAAFVATLIALALAGLITALTEVMKPDPLTTVELRR